jgi:hypothetical protein
MFLEHHLGAMQHCAARAGLCQVISHASGVNCAAFARKAEIA